MAITIDQVLNGLDVVLAITSAVFFHGQIKNARVAAIAKAIAAAEKSIDKAAYTDQGQLNVARETFALAVLDHLLPGADPVKVKADLEAVLADIHKHAAEANV